MSVGALAGALISQRPPDSRQLMAFDGNARNKQIVQGAPPRTSSLQAPIMQLVGHDGEINSAKFSPNGTVLASASFDRQILLWNVFGDCENYGMMTGHTGAILELCFSRDGSMIFTASTDKTGAVWDFSVGQRIKKLKGHTSFVNSCAVSQRGVQLAATGSDDGTMKLWDIRQKNATQTLNNTYQVTTVTFSDTGEQLFAGGIDNEIKAWDLRQSSVTYSMKGHGDTLTGLSLSPNGYYLLSNSMDNTVRIWDVRPFAPADRQLKIFQGHQHNFEKTQHVKYQGVWESGVKHSCYVVGM